MAHGSAEARARVAAETDLLRHRKNEFERLLKTRDRQAAIVTLVEKHKREYDELVRSHRQAFERTDTAA